MVSKLDELLPTIIDAGDTGLSAAKINATFAGKSKPHATALREKLATLIRDGAIWGPLKHGVAQYYFATGRGPSIETASEAIVDLGACPSSRWSSGDESDWLRGYEQGFSPLEDR